MIHIDRYVCEVCGKEYGSSVKCKECEESHLVPLEIVDFGYVNSDLISIKKETTVPTYIHVKMNDGLVRCYHLYGSGIGFQEMNKKKSKGVKIK